MRALAAIVVALAAPAAFALETATWPPPAPEQDRMHALQQVIIDPQSSAAKREAAREELANLLRGPAGQRPAGEEKPARPPRAAIVPFPSVVRPLPPEKNLVPPSEVAHVEVIQPPKPVVIPGKGTVAVPTAPTLPAPGFAVDPLTGNVLHGVPGGYVDPKTGQFIPR